MKIAVIGCGYVGLTSGTCLAELGNNVICVDIGEEKIEKLSKGEMPIYEPGLKELVERNTKEKRLSFTTDLKDSIKKSEIIFICVGTPPKENGEADLSYVENVARQIAEHMESYKVIIEKSTVPVETGEKVAETIKQNNKHNVEFDVVSNPEFLREGSAVYDTFNPDRIVIGANSEKAINIMKKLYEPIKAPLIITDIRSAEIIKHASNSFLATKISFINAIANICELTGADIEKVAEGIGFDKRIGRRFLNAGIGYGGFCLSGEEFVFLGNPHVKLLKFKTAFNDTPNKKRIVTLGFNGKESKIADVILVSKRRFKGNMVGIRTNMGRSIEVTHNHPMMVVENGELKVKLASELAEGDSLPLSTKFPYKPVKKIDVIGELMKHAFRGKVKVRHKSKGFVKHKKIISKLKCPSTTKHDFMRYNSIPIQYFVEIDQKAKINRNDLLLFTSKGNTTHFPAVINLDKDFFRLLGYYLSEGCIHYEKGKRGIRARMTFHFNKKEKEYIADLTNILEKLGIKYTKAIWSNVTRITVSSRIFAFVLDEILNCGKDSYTANIPMMAFFASEKNKRELLKGLFRGDGSVYFHNHSEAVTIEYGTASEKLAQGILLLLQSLAIIPGLKLYQDKKSKAPNYFIRISSNKQVKKMLFFDKEKNSRIKKRLSSYKKYIIPIGFKNYDGFSAVKIKKTEKFYDERDVYSMEIADKSHLFITSGGIIVHNCFPKDAAAFIRIAEKYGYDFKLMKAVQEINEKQKGFFIKKIEKALWNLKDKKIGVLGLAFKPNTDDMRFAPSVDIINALQKEGAKIKAYDPESMEKAKDILKNVEYCKDPYETAKDVDVLLILTEWNEFKELNLEKIKNLMKNKLVIDGRNIYNPEEMKKLGFNYVSIGRK